MTLEHWRKDQILLRLEHIFEKDEDRFLSLPENVRIQVCIFPSILWHFKFLLVRIIKKTILASIFYKCIHIIFSLIIVKIVILPTLKVKLNFII